ncbi:MAG: histidine phosphatase family protein, partial [Dongiaceae bacterium]
DDCSTQRNLDAAGREQAVALGEALRRQSIVVDRLLTSPWCRCRETAALLDVGTPEDYAPLGYVFSNRAAEADSTAALRSRIAAWRGAGTLVMISHGATIGALTGIQPQQGEILVVEPQSGSDAGFRIVGRIPPEE